MLEHLPSIQADQLMGFLEENLTTIASGQTGLLHQLQERSPAIHDAVQLLSRFMVYSNNPERDATTAFLLILALVSEGFYSLELGEAIDELCRPPDEAEPS